MTKDIAIKILDPETSLDELREYEDAKERLEAVNEVCRVACAAIRAQQAKLDRSRFGCEWCGFAKITLPPERRIAYCEKCGCPLTEEAWAELERRINGGTADN